MRYQDHTGKRFGRLIVLSRIANAPNGARRYDCLCDCGAKTEANATNLVSGDTKSCGCLKLETKSNLKHGGNGTLTFNRWRAMRARCMKKSAIAYERYGGRGITICDRWLESFANFLQDMGECQGADMTLERLDNNKGYEPGNCIWATRLKQNRNKSNNTLLTFNGETACISEWAEKTGISAANISNRLRMGWSVERALTKIFRRPT